MASGGWVGLSPAVRGDAARTASKSVHDEAGASRDLVLPGTASAHPSEAMMSIRYMASTMKPGGPGLTNHNTPNRSFDSSPSRTSLAACTARCSPTSNTSKTNTWPTITRGQMWKVRSRWSKESSAIRFGQKTISRCETSITKAPADSCAHWHRQQSDRREGRMSAGRCEGYCRRLNRKAHRLDQSC